MYELIILSHLMRKPAHGYLIAKIINDIYGPFARLSNGRFYPLLAKLEHSGLIALHHEATMSHHGDRPARQYLITDKGKERYYQLMLDTTSNPGEYQKIFLQKTQTLDLLQPDERLFLIEHYVNYCHAHVLHLRAEEEDLIQFNGEYGLRPIELESALSIIRHIRKQWQLELDWARELREKEKLAQAQVPAEALSG